MKTYWLVLDIGNTHTVAGLYPHPTEAGALPQSHVRFRTDSGATSDEYRMNLAQLFAHDLNDQKDFWKKIQRVVVSTVVPSLERVIEKACPNPIFINSKTKRDFDLELPNPEQLGADRLANVAGALTLGPAPFLIVDAGTATTFCLVTQKKGRPTYIGGAITPGIEISWKALQTRAAKLFSVELVRIENSVGNTTETQIQSGVVLGYEALIEGMTDRLLKDAGESMKGAKLIATGGCINFFSLSSRFQIEPDLTLQGLLRYGQLNS